MASGSSGPLLSAADYASLSSACGVHAEVLARRLAHVRLTDFKVTELKEILKWLRTRPAWQLNPLVHARTPVSSSGTAGKKNQIVDHLKNILLAQQAGTTAATPATDPAAASAMYGNPAMAMQAQYRAQQQQMQNAAARFQASADPSRYSSGAPRPNNGLPQQQTYATTPYQQPQAYAYQQYGANMQQQQQAQQAQQQQQQRYQQHPMAPATNGYLYNGAGAYPSAAAAVPASSSSSHLSHPALQQQAKANEINTLTSCPAMKKLLSPYEQNVQALARNLLNATSHTPNQSSGAAGGAYHTTLTFNISQAYLSKMKRSGRVVPAGQEAQVLEVHLRLFSAITMDHHPWDKKFRVIVNGHEITIPEPKKLSKSKKKGLELVRGLDVSEYVQASNTVEVSVYRQSYTVELFRGLVLADLIRIRDTSELMEEFRKTVADDESKMQATALERSCIICASKKDPLRCSRCKSEWYCGAVHQRDHWSVHREKCAQPTKEQDEAREALEKRAAQLAMLGPNGRTRLTMPVKVKHEQGGVDEDDEDVEEVDALVPLRCPLSLERFEYPARGRLCGHLQCFNLETYLMFSQQSGVWQCPVCYKGLPYEEITVSLQMAAILRETTDQDIVQIRVHPDGQYDSIRAIPDGESGDGREPGRGKRKQPASSPPPPPAAKVAAVGSGATPDTSASAAATSAPSVVTNGYSDWSSAAASTVAAEASTASGASSLHLQSHSHPSPTPATDPPSSSVVAASALPSALVPSPTSGGAAGTADEPIELD